MDKSTKILATVIACLALAGTCLADTKTTYRDAQGRLQGIIVSAMPFLLGIAMLVLKPDVMRPFVFSLKGICCIGAVVALVTVGWLIIRKIIKIDV